MRFFTKFSFSFLLLVTCYLLLVTPNVRAQGEFESNYDVVYLVDNNGTTEVTQNITLKNLTPNMYADRFELKIGSTKVENVKATDGLEPLETETKFENNLTTISVKFNQKVIGIDKTLSWILSYSSKELATKSGQIWEISIPRLGQSADIGIYSAKVSTPKAFGPVAFTLPEPKTSQQLGLRQEFTFDKDQLLNSGVAMSFGEKQVFSFTLNYFLENDNLTSRTVQIALPPDNNYQKVVLEKIEPEPVNINTDSDNNFLASYKLSPKQKQEVKATGFVEVFSKPFRNIKKNLSNEQRQLYTQPQRYWETDDPFIKDKAAELKTPENIHNFVTEFLNYSQERLNLPQITRMGAAAAITSPNEAVCMEFTDLFIAIARAAGIPAREVEGFAYTQNERLRPLSLASFGGDILHAWPEYWNEELGWVQVDPTWQSTSGGLDYFNKLDFNHITFASRGISSTAPFPAGAYKTPDKLQEKSVFVSFAQELPNVTSTPQLALLAPPKILSGVPVKAKATVQNIGSTSIIGEDLILKTSALANISKIKNPQGETGSFTKIQNIPILPPLSKKEFTFNLQNEGLFKNTTDAIILSFADTQISQPVEIVPLYQITFLPAFAASFAIALTIILSGLFIYKRAISKNKVPPGNFF